MRPGVGRNVSVSGRAQSERTERGQAGYPQQIRALETRTLIARFFVDLRRALRLTLPQAAHYLEVHPQIVEALETGEVEYLPPRAEVARIVMTYAAMAGVDGRPVLNAIGGLLAEPPLQPAVQSPPVPRPRPRYAAQEPAPRAVGHFRRAGSVIASGAKRLPQEAIDQIRERPQRALYALSLPLALLLLTLHTSVVDLVAKPFSTTVRSVSVYFQERFAPVRDGLRYIEVDDPRSRRTDKLRITSGSY
jgi:hypothetical protein